MKKMFLRKFRFHKIIMTTIIIFITVSCMQNSSEFIIKKSAEKQIYTGIGMGNNEVEALKNAKNNAIEQIIESMGVNVEINSILENTYVCKNDSVFNNLIKKTRINFNSKAFLKIHIISRKIKKMKSSVYAEIKIVFDKNDFESTYKFFLKNYSKLIPNKITSFEVMTETLKIIEIIDHKIDNISGINNLPEWKEYQIKRNNFISEYRNMPVNFVLKTSREGKNEIMIDTDFKINNGFITLKIGDKLLPKKINNNSFQMISTQEDVCYIFGNWQKWKPEFSKNIILQKPEKIRIRLADFHKNNFDNFSELLKIELEKSNFKVVKSAPILIKISKKVYFENENIANTYFAKMNYKIQIYRNTELIGIITFPNDEFPTQIIADNDKSQLVKKVSDFKKFSNYKWVLKKIVIKIKDLIKN